MEESFSKYAKALENEAILEQLLSEQGISRIGLEAKIIARIESKKLSNIEKTLILCIACILFCIGSYWGYSITSYLELTYSDLNLIFSSDGLTL